MYLGGNTALKSTIASVISLVCVCVGGRRRQSGGLAQGATKTTSD